MPSTSTALSISAIVRRAAATLAVLAGAAGAQLTPEWISTLPVGTDLSAGLNAYVIDDAGITYVTGSKGGPIGYLDIVTAAFAPDGTLLWQRAFDGPKHWHDQSSAIALGPGGVLYVTGNTPNPDFYAETLLLEYDAATGNLLNTVVHSTGLNAFEYGGSVVTDASGNVYVAGALGADGTDALVLKYDASGVLQWMRTWDGPAFEPYTLDSAGKVVIDPNGDVVVLIHGVMASNHPDYVVVKYAPDTGDTIWTSIVGDNGEDAPRDMELDAGGDIYVTGTHGVFQTSKFFTIKLRGTDGALLWQAYDSLAFTNSAMALALDGAGGVYVTGSWDPDDDVSNSNDNMRTVKRDAATGTLRWAHVYGSNAKFQFDAPSDVVADPAGHVFVGGLTNSPPYVNDMITLVLDAQTGLETDRHIIPGGPGLDAESDIMAFDADFNLYNGGTTVNGTTGARNMSLVKFTTLASPPYQMILSQLVSGSNATFAVAQATPLQLQLIAFSLAGTAAIPIPSLGVTLGLANPQLLLMAPANLSGAFSIPLHIPTGAIGVTAWFQTLQVNGATPVVKRTVQ